MQGPEGAAGRVATWLTTAIPRRLRIIEARLGLDDRSIADPDHVLAHERGPIGVEEWPAVYALPQRLDRLELVDVNPDGGETYRATYAMRVLAWVRADDYDTTDTLRKRYALAIREALLERKVLELAGSVVAGNPDADLAVDPMSIREDYGPVVVDEAARTIAGVYVDVAITVIETIAGPDALGTADTIAVDEEALAPHPAL